MCTGVELVNCEQRTVHSEQRTGVSERGALVGVVGGERADGAVVCEQLEHRAPLGRRPKRDGAGRVAEREHAARGPLREHRQAAHVRLVRNHHLAHRDVHVVQEARFGLRSTYTRNRNWSPTLQWSLSILN